MPSAGGVTLQGQDLSRVSEARRGRLRNAALGFVYQFHHLLPEFTALENVAMPLYIRRLSRAEADQNVAAYPSPVFLLGKVLNALLLDPVRYDLQVMDRLNRLMGALEDNLTPEEMSRVDEVLTRSRGAPYRKIDTLVFAPSVDIGRMAHDHARRTKTRNASSLLVRRLADLRDQIESDLLSFILFDGEFAESLATLGKRDALARSEEIVDFFT